MSARFKITYSCRMWNPWELHEWYQPKRWFARGFWSCLGSFQTQDEAAKHMNEKVRGECLKQPAYYDHYGYPEVDY